MDYNEAYLYLFNAITDAIDKLQDSKYITKELQQGIDILIKAQQHTEDMYCDEVVEDPPIYIIKTS